MAAELKQGGGVVLAPAVLGFKRGRPLSQDAERLPGTWAAVDLLRAVVRRMPHTRRLSSRLIYWTHHRFDVAMARHLARLDAAVVVGYPGAMLETMRATPRALHVVNMVNGTPAAHNAALAGLGLPSRHQELVPTSVTSRVEHELRLADLVLCPSKAVQSQLQELGLSADRIEVLPYGQRPVPQVRRQTAARPRALALGQIGWRKGTDILVAAARLCPDIDFVVVGPVVSPEVLRDLPTNLAMLGEAQQSQVADLMAEAHVLVLPTREDSFGLVVSEALASGLPVVVSSAAGSSEMVPPEAAVVVSGADPVGYAEALRSLFAQGWARWIGARDYLDEHGGPSPSWDEYARECLQRITEEAAAERDVRPWPSI